MKPEYTTPSSPNKPRDPEPPELSELAEKLFRFYIALPSKGGVVDQIPQRALEAFGFSMAQTRSALRELSAAGLVKVELVRGKSPRIHLLAKTIDHQARMARRESRIVQAIGNAAYQLDALGSEYTALRDPAAAKRVRAAAGALRTLAAGLLPASIAPGGGS